MQATRMSARLLPARVVLAFLVGLVVVATPPPEASAADPVVLVGAGDISSCSSTGDEATAALVQQIEGQVFTLGDLVYDGVQRADFDRCYDPSWGAFRDRTRPTIGNHEYSGSTAPGYFDYFGAAAGEGTKGYYSYEAGSWHVVVLNSNCGKVGGCGAGSAQETWLRQDLAASPASCTLAMWHHPRFSSGRNGDSVATQPLWQALWDNGVELLLSGHDHDYERFRPLSADGSPDDLTGVRQLVVGTGGRSHTSFLSTHPHSEVRDYTSFGVVKMTLGEGSYDWEFVPVPGATFTDAGSGSCHGRPADTTRPQTSITSGPPESTTDTTAELAFTSDKPGSTFACTVDGGTAAPCTSPLVLSGLSAGNHSLSVTATDPSGNTDQSPATWAWQVTTGTTPQTMVVEADADSQVVLAARYAGTNYGSGAVLLSDGKPRTDSYLRFSVPPVPGQVASARLRVWARDGTSNGPSVATTSATWSESTITWNNRPLPGPVVANVGRVGAGTWVDYNLGTVVTGQGGYGFALLPESEDGLDVSSRENSDLRRPQLVLTYVPGEDTSAPSTTISSGPPAQTADQSATIDFSSDEPGSTYTCTLDGSAAEPCTSPFAAIALGPGTHEFSVAATDAAGNTDQSPAVWTWEVVEEPPPPVPTDWTFVAAGDAQVREAAPTTNDGSLTTMTVDGSPRFETLLRFDLGSLTGTVTAARLRVWVSDGTTNGPRLSTAPSTWSESSVTWATRPAPVAQVGNVGRVGRGVWLEYVVTPVVSAAGSYSFVLQPEGNDGMQLSSREAAVLQRPELLVTTR